MPDENREPPQTEPRVSRLRLAMGGRGLEALVVTKRENVRYLSGFTGSSGFVVVTGDRAVLITDGRYSEQAGRETTGWDVVIYASDLMAEIASAVEPASTVGLEDSSTVAFGRKLAAALAGVEPRPEGGLVECLRLTKEPKEIAAIRAAVGCAAKAWETLLPMLQPGLTERQLAASLDYRMLTAGADRPAFDTVVASGPDGSMPHAGVTDRPLKDGDLVVIDFGAQKDGYCCDITRTVGIGEVDARPLEALDAVRRAWDSAFGAAVEGARAADVDKAARDLLEEAGLGGNFVHSTGHGVGLEVHEKPTLSRLSDEILQPGMVFTIEPGVYIEGSFGVRHEETVLLTPQGPEALSKHI